MGYGGHSVIFLVDSENCVTDAVGPGVDQRLRDAVAGVTLNPNDGCCGAAIACGKRVIVSNVETDPLERDYRDILGEIGYAACWSQPIFSRNGHILGTLATFYSEPMTPSEAETVYIDGAAIWPASPSIAGHRNVSCETPVKVLKWPTGLSLGSLQP